MVYSPLLSGIVVGFLMNRYISTVDYTVGDFRLKLILASNADAFVAAEARTWTVDKVELILEHTDLAPDTVSVIYHIKSGRYVV